MNMWQLLRQAQYVLRARAWTGGATKVFASQSVLVSLARPQDLAGARLPAVILRPLSGSPDPRHRQQPGLLQRSFAATLVTGVMGDIFGEAPIVGSHRAALTQSEGRGHLEVEEELLQTLGDLGAAGGVTIRLMTSSVPEPQQVEGLGHVVSTAYAFEAFVLRDRYYPGATQFLATRAGGNVGLSWALPPDRFDRLSVILRRAAGATPPATATAGTGVTLSGDLATTVTDSPGAGTFSYSLFAAYDETGSGTPERYSSAETHTVT